MATPYALQTIDAEGSNLEDARDVVRSQLPKGLAILSVQVVSREQGLSILDRGETIEEAYAKAENKVPDGMEVVRKEVVVSPDRAVVTVEAFDEVGAEQIGLAQAKARLWNGGLRVDAIKLVEAGRTKLPGIRKALPNRYEVEVSQLATVDVHCFKKAQIRATVGIPPELSRDQMQALHGLLAIFAAYGGQGDRSGEGLRRHYVAWWQENQTTAPEIAETLGLISESGSRVIDREQASQLRWLLDPADLLKSSHPLGEDEITSRLGFGEAVTEWVVGSMHLLGRGYFKGAVVFDKCYEELGAELAGRAAEVSDPSADRESEVKSEPPPRPPAAQESLKCNRCASAIDHFGFTQADAAQVLSSRGQPNEVEIRHALMRAVGGTCPQCGRIYCAKCYYDEDFSCPSCAAKISELGGR